MSQNSNSLVLFFDDENLHKTCLLMLINLERGDFDKASKFSDCLGVTSLMASSWEEDWFNCEVNASPGYIQFYFETRASENHPYQLLENLFASGLSAAVLNVFYDQVGEKEVYFFKDAHQVDAGDFYSEKTSYRKVVNELFGDIAECQVDGGNTPLKELIVKSSHSVEDTKEMLKAIVEIANVSRETGTPPDEVLKNILVLRAAGKGALHALLFGLFTILMFKGLWLWITLTVILVVALPLYQVSSLGLDEEEESDCDDGAETVC